MRITCQRCVGQREAHSGRLDPHVVPTSCDRSACHRIPQKISSNGGLRVRLLCRSYTISDEAIRTALRKCASCCAGLPRGSPGITRLKLVPSGHSRLQPALASMLIVGMMISRPETCAGSIVPASRRSATWPSYSFP